MAKDPKRLSAFEFYKKQNDSPFNRLEKRVKRSLSPDKSLENESKSKKPKRENVSKLFVDKNKQSKKEISKKVVNSKEIQSPKQKVSKETLKEISESSESEVQNDSIVSSDESELKDNESSDSSVSVSSYENKDDEIDEESFDDAKSSSCESCAMPVQPIEEAKNLLSELVGNDVEDFTKNVFGKKALLSRKSLNSPTRSWFHHDAIYTICQRERIIIGEDLHLARYQDNVKTSYEEGSRAYPPLVKEMFKEDLCTVRLTQPHRYYKPLAERISLLQEIFNSAMGCNAYYTPSQSQGFAPHYDDIDAFVIQLEGTKHWRVYKPRSDQAYDLESSRDFLKKEIKNCECVIDAILEPGDVLYMPRSFIHYAFAQSDEDSLHITISTYQHNSWYDLLQKLLPLATKDFLKSNVHFRMNLPLGFLDYTGTCKIEKRENAILSDSMIKQGPSKPSKKMKVKTILKKPTERFTFERTVRSFLHALADWEHLPIDKACDLLALDVVRSSFPPVLTVGEEYCHSSSASFEPTLESLVRLARNSTIRIVPCEQVGVEITDQEREELENEPCSENIGVLNSKKVAKKGKQNHNETPLDKKYHCLFHNLINSYDGNSSKDDLGNYHVVSHQVYDAVMLLRNNYPEYTSVKDFPSDHPDHKLDSALTLFRMGLLVVYPNETNDLNTWHHDDSSSVSESFDEKDDQESEESDENSQ